VDHNEVWQRMCSSCTFLDAVSYDHLVLSMFSDVQYRPALCTSTNERHNGLAVYHHHPCSCGQPVAAIGKPCAVPSPETLNMLCCNMQIEAQGEEDSPAAAATKTTAKDNAAKVIDASSACL